MIARPAPPELEEFLRAFDAGVVDVALALRSRVLDVIPRAHEIVWDATNAVSIVHGASERWTTDGVTHIAVYSGHANLGFNDGATLGDPLGILVGSGVRIRHVSFATADAVLAATWMDDYVTRAVLQTGHDLAMGDGGTTVRRSRGAKRRPNAR